MFTASLGCAVCAAQTCPAISAKQAINAVFPACSANLRVHLKIAEVLPITASPGEDRDFAFIFD
jgi:hypothetical protein